MAAIDAGADLLGFNTWKGTKRFIDLDGNAGWIASLPSRVCRVALLINASRSEAERIAALPFIDALQFHGDEDAAYCGWAAGLGKPIIKAIRARDASLLDAVDSFATPHILLDAHVPGEFGGTGARVDLALARRFRLEHPGLILWLAGGLTAANVGEAVRIVQPRVVDVSSGVESAPGRKEVGKMSAFVSAVSGA